MPTGSSHHFDGLQDGQGNLSDANLNSLDAGCNVHAVLGKLLVNIEPGRFVSSAAFEDYAGAIDQPVPASTVAGVVYLLPAGPTLVIAAGPFPGGEHMPLAEFDSDGVQVLAIRDKRATVGTSVIGGGPPSGAAGGVLSGTYPNPGFAAGAVLNAHVNAAAAIAESKLALNNPTHANANDPSAGEKNALAGTTGVPGGGNEYVTTTDPRMADARTAAAHAASHQDGGADEVATITPAADSIPKALGTGKLDDAWVNLQVRGRDRVYAVAEGRTTTTLALPQLKLQVITPVLTGTYMVHWQADVDNNNSVLLGTVRLQDVSAAATLDQNEYGNAAIPLTAPKRVSGFVELVLVAETKTIEIQWFDQAGGGTQGIQRARIEFFRVG
jgi:hypothetical protein